MHKNSLHFRLANNIHLPFFRQPGPLFLIHTLIPSNIRHQNVLDYMPICNTSKLLKSLFLCFPLQNHKYNLTNKVHLNCLIRQLV